MIPYYKLTKYNLFSHNFNFKAAIRLENRVRLSNVKLFKGIVKKAGDDDITFKGYLRNLPHILVVRIIYFLIFT